MRKPSISEALRIARKRYADGGFPTDIDPITGLPRQTGGGGSDITGSSQGPTGSTQASTDQTGQGPTYSTNPTGIGFLDNAVNNPGTTAINAAVGMVPGIGIANTVSGLFGGPTIGGLATGSYGNPTAMSATSYTNSAPSNAPAAPAAPASAPTSAPAAPSAAPAQTSVAPQEVAQEDAASQIGSISPSTYAALDAQNQEAANAVANVGHDLAQGTTWGVQAPQTSTPHFATYDELQANPDIEGPTSVGNSISNFSYGALNDQNQQENAMLDAINNSLAYDSTVSTSDPGTDPGAWSDSSPSDTSYSDSSSSDSGWGDSSSSDSSSSSDGGSGDGGGAGGGGDGGGGGGDGGGGGGGDKRGGYIRPKHRASGGMVDKALKAVDAHRYPLRKHADWGKHQEYKETGGKITQMSPSEFLGKAEKMRMSDVDKDAIHHFKKKMKKGKSLNPLALFPKGGQDGRHRAMAAKELGIKKVPVITWPHKSEGGSIVKRALVVASKSAKSQRGRP